MKILSGLDVMVTEEFAPLRGRRIGVVCNQASITRDLRHITDVFCDAHRRGEINLQAFFGPQHGIWGHTQDNMIEWEGFIDARTGIPTYSLYGVHRKPTEAMLSGIDTLVVDLQDVGARYYTFVWTTALCLEAGAEQGIEVWVLDRPNPISGGQMEGCVQQDSFRSFVGLYPLPVRHGMTIGEMAGYLQARFHPRCRLTVVPMQGWQRSMYFDETGRRWIMPSPNMPSVETAIVYPGLCLLEATNLSEGRGTTRPFEILGAPWLDGWSFAAVLNNLNLPGVYFRPIEFQPTFNKHAGEKCGGVFVHVMDRHRFEPFLTGVAILSQARRCYPDRFQWKTPPYEYEYEKMPFDILVGNGWLRPMIDAQRPLADMKLRWQEELKAFVPVREAFLLYSAPTS
jgi:uncharacterized protein YbbC (DUF1343 family)